ncbi:uncharacterized protein LOC143914676 [Arctopsyche grandis]|uniref:uncharacterized protein LOC143914676 n=1 Tax=Arctopsyche grandis TaxID=121162 RepID=UPI00406D8FF1
MVVLDKCCCCFSLKNGILCIIWFCLFENIINLSSLIFEYSNLRTYKFEDNLNKEVFNEAFTPVFSLVVATEVIDIITGAVLLYGVYSKKKLMLLPWLVNNGLGIIFITLSILIGSIVCFLIKDMASYGFSLLFMGIFVCGIYIYIWLCVFSFYQKLKEDSVITGRRDGEVEPMVSERFEMTPPAYSRLQNKPVANTPAAETVG